MGKQLILANDFRRQWAETEHDVIEAARKVGASGWYILGQEVSAFERDLAAACGRGHVVGCANGLDAIEIALRALGVKRGEKVLTTPLSAFATTLALLRCGCVPVFVDVDESGLIDLDAVEEELARDPSIRCLLPVHLYGHAVDLNRLEAIRQRTGTIIIEDMAQAIGALSHGRSVGSVGQASATSFYPTKNLGALGDGGALLTDDTAVDAAARVLRDYGQTAKYVHVQEGLNSRLDELQAAILLSAFLPRLEKWTSRRRQIALQFIAGIDNPSVRLLPAPSSSTSVWHLFPLRVSPSQRDDFMEHLKSEGVQGGIHYPRLIPDQQAMVDVAHEVRGRMPRAQAIAAGEVSLPIHPYLTDGEVIRILDAVNSWHGQ